MVSRPSIAAMALGVLVASCASDHVRWETAHPITTENERWSSPQDVSVDFVNPYHFDLCIQEYQWPEGTPAADVLVVRDRRGRTASFIGDEPVVVGGHIRRVRAGSRHSISIDLRQAYNTSELEPPFTLEYSVFFHEC